LDDKRFKRIKGKEFFVCGKNIHLNLNYKIIQMMEANKILSSGFLDILFEGRNKAYGAYDLRKTYNDRMWKALLIVALLFIAISAAAILSKKFTPQKNASIVIIPDVTISTLHEEEKKIELPPPPPLKTPPPPKVATTAFASLKVVDDKEVKEPPPQQTDLNKTKIGTKNIDGINDPNIVTSSPPIDEDKGIISVVKKPESDAPFIRVEIDAEYFGGTSAWKKFLERNLRSDIPVENGAPSGSYTVMIQFVVDVNGKVSNIVPLTNIGFGMEQEAIRVLKKSGDWKPAVQNSRNVKAYRKQPITFQVVVEQ
jgi:protein TonB